MLYLSNKFNLEKEQYEILNLTNNQIAIKIKNPRFIIHEEYKLPWQAMLYKTQTTDRYDYDNVVVVPLIPQYFHNFYEVFPKLVLLKNMKENFIVVIVRPEERETGIFYSLIRNNNLAQCNAAHMLDFLKYFNINFVCLTPEELMSKKYKSTYLFYDSGSYGGLDHTIAYNDTKYTISYFLKVPVPEILLENSLLLRNEFPKIDIDINTKIFISRKKGHHRPYEHQDKLENSIIELGYESVLMEDLSLLDQIKYIQKTEWIVVPYGSGLVNGAFCNKNKILSLNYTEGYYVDTYDKIFNMYNIDYKNINIFNSDIDTIKNIVFEWGKNEK